MTLRSCIEALRENQQEGAVVKVKPSTVKGLIIVYNLFYTSEVMLEFLCDLLY